MGLMACNFHVETEFSTFQFHEDNNLKEKIYCLV